MSLPVQGSYVSSKTAVRQEDGGFTRRERFLAWPGGRFLRFAWTLSGLCGLWFAAVYGGCDWATARRVFRVRLDLPGELASVPFVPWTVVFYLSIYGLFAAGPFVVRGRRELAALAGALALATLLGGVGFLLLPAANLYPAPSAELLGAWRGLYRFADVVNLDYNLFPSLHVALSVVCVAAFCRHAGRSGRCLLWAWAVAISLSTLLTHQHYLADVVGGWAMGLLCDQVGAVFVRKGNLPFLLSSLAQ